MRPAGIIFLLFLAGRLSAQHISATVIDNITKEPVTYATVSTKKAISFTNTAGVFSLNIGNNDTITISHIGYKTYKIATGNNLIPNIIYLQPDNVMLNEVAIKSTRNYKKDSLSNRREFAKAFAYKAPGLKDIFVTRSPCVNTNRPNNTSELVSINVLQVISLLGKNNTPQSKLKKTLLRDEQNSYVDKVFSKEKVTSLTGLKGDSLQNFMFKYRLSINEIKKMTAYDMAIYIKKSYADFVMLPISRKENTYYKLSDLLYLLLTYCWMR